MLDRIAHQAEHLAKALEWARGLPPGAYLSHESAALVHGMPVYAVPAQVRVTGSRLRSTATSDLHVHRAGLRPWDVTVVDGVPVTSRARTAVDIARWAGFGEALVTADAVLAAGTRRADLADVLRHQWTWPRIRRAMPVVRHADGRSESALESWTRSRVILLGLPLPRLQFNIFGANGWVARSDFYWDGWRVAGEADGRVKYLNDELWAEKQRQDDIEDAGLEVIRWTWRTAHVPDEEFARRLWRKLRRGRMLAALEGPI